MRAVGVWGGGKGDGMVDRGACVDRGGIGKSLLYVWVGGMEI